MGIGAIQPMHLLVIIVVTTLLIIAAVIGVALFLLRHAVRYSHQPREHDRRDNAPMRR